MLNFTGVQFSGNLLKCIFQKKIYVIIYICTWNPNDPCFDWKRPCFGGLTFKNRGHLGSRLYIYILYIVGTWILVAYDLPN